MEAGFSLLKNTITNMKEEKFWLNPGVLNAIMDLLEETHGF